MCSAPIPRPANEPERLAALRRYGILDTPNDEDFDFLTEMAAYICQAPYSFVTLVDEDRVWVKSGVGLPAGIQRPRDDDYCAWAILAAQGMQVADLLSDARTAGLPLTHERGYRMYSGVNLHVGDGLHIGTLCVLDTRPRELTPTQQHLLQRLGRQVMALIELRAAQRELRLRNDALHRLSRHDELTGLANRRELMEALARELAHGARYGGVLSVALLDVDHFKTINDRFGHPAGDEVLRRLAQALLQGQRSVDTVGRYGGEEFMVVLPQTGLEGARVAMELARARIAALHLAAPMPPVTVSAGIAACVAGACDAQALIAAADRALYRAKRAGRNRIMLADAGEIVTV